MQLIYCSCAALQLTSFLPTATPLPELQAIATGSFAGGALAHACISQRSAVRVSCFPLGQGQSSLLCQGLCPECGPTLT